MISDIHRNLDISVYKCIFSCHIYVTPMHTKPGIKERMLGDMKDSAKKLMAKPKEKLDGRVRNARQQLAYFL